MVYSTNRERERKKEREMKSEKAWDFGYDLMWKNTKFKQNAVSGILISQPFKAVLEG